LTKTFCGFIAVYGALLVPVAVCDALEESLIENAFRFGPWRKCGSWLLYSTVIAMIGSDDGTA